ncbi:UDP-N-acetylmuramoylalanyl-D-glutamyl-2, 6-diaminopimelate--D-alanyl-D-alanine ligase [Pacificimonas flava]|uniref:UDP-N-acetylmuramoyl-tripeptide--D-alanyl-D-alanine ligase n=2 Tax=Pacificimonas TaxID=1960290 RepID=A0A219B7S8_9SPHN|nr:MULTISPECIES: UDP-N-acetylmuramoyl-tripeptide--D-alanyl-D-alanine ligase [Pacificimonas]MBZ6378909.1 UDP-N-acetylmuramoyl-tripeptide--D-alanyl-D-alanine ligase [Pacificimonas aurantium]OWV33839.1 UDP-N-acetylmuramoylalanyl-D-glutamyl-2, 6-diaminopimelate--D-alanyl-D-alanine ligase [Pacificimonas flava]
MTALWTSAEIAAASGGQETAEFSCDAVTFDSREVMGGELFVAMKGEQADGHDYLDMAFDRGAAGALVSRPSNHPHVLVEDGLEGLEALAKEARLRAKNASVIGVTGSVGKTSVKEAIRHALQAAEPERTHWSVKSYNNHTGVPLSLARMPRETRYGVFEMGMNHAGELSRLTRFVRPHIAIVTAIAPAHIEFFGTEEAIADAKAEIFEGLEPGGTAILPADSPHFERLRRAATRYADRILTFGLSEGADIRPLGVEPGGEGRDITVQAGEERVLFRLMQPGDHSVRNAMAALAAVHAAGGDIAAAGLGLASLRGLEGRGAQYLLAWESGEVRLIDESYNANNASMEAALSVLRGAEISGRRLAVLGAMKELGARSDELHLALARPIEASNVDRVALVGEEMRPLAEALEAPLFDAAAEAEAWLRDTLEPGDAVLLKGSNSVGLSKIVAALRGGAA